MAGLLDLLLSRGETLLDMPHGAADARSRNDMAASGILARMLSGMDNPAPTYDQPPPGGFFVRSSARPIDLRDAERRDRVSAAL
jgi:hypothetical protein